MGRSAGDLYPWAASGQMHCSLSQDQRHLEWGVTQPDCCCTESVPIHTEPASMCFPLTLGQEQGGQGDSDSEVTPSDACRQFGKHTLTFLSTEWSPLTKSHYTECVTHYLCFCHRTGLPRKAIHSSSCPCGLSSLSPLTRQGPIVHPVLSRLTLIDHNLPSQLES